MTYREAAMLTWRVLWWVFVLAASIILVFGSMQFGLWKGIGAALVYFVVLFAISTVRVQRQGAP